MLKASTFGVVVLIGLATAISAQTQQPAPAATPTPVVQHSAKASQKAASNNWYVRPDAKKRFNRYVKGVVGPFALAKYAGTAGIASLRNTPSEWGDNWSGYGRRYANALGKSAISNTTMYALDETLKVDSAFYRSQSRNVSARLRNAIFSPFTARNESGKRVFGIPRIAGTVASNVISSEVWYPKRFNYVHGLKGVPISLAFNAGFNLFKEFVWKKK